LKPPDGDLYMNGPMTKQGGAMSMTKQAPDIHTCSYYCSRPECITRQRDQMRDWIHETLGNDEFIKMMLYKPEEQQ
jgi:hypothetical protein